MRPDHGHLIADDITKTFGDLAAFKADRDAALVEQSAAAAESLRDQASRLAEVVRQFRIEGRAVRAV